jgi:hypothetical protein
MKIEKVIFTIDDNPHYKGFWKSISKHYKQKMDMDPVLFVIGDASSIDHSSYDSTNGEVRIVDKIDGVPTIIQALIGKFYFTGTEPNTTWMIGDLDLYPLQKEHFINRIKNIDDNSYVHLNPYAYGENWREDIYGLAGYNHVAKGITFQEELNFKNKTFQEVCYEILSSDKFGIKFYKINENKENRMASPDHGWFCCEEMYTGNLLRESSKLIEIPPAGPYFRIDRSDMKYDTQWIRSGKYIDFHAPRPYEEYSSEIENILSFFPEAYD